MKYSCVLEKSIDVDENEVSIIKFIIYLIGMIIIKMVSIHNMVQLVMCAISIATVFFLAPVDNDNNKLIESEKKCLVHKVRNILSIETATFVLLLIVRFEYWSKIIAIAISFVAVLVLIGFIENKIRG